MPDSPEVRIARLDESLKNLLNRLEAISEAYAPTNKTVIENALKIAEMTADILDVRQEISRQVAKREHARRGPSDGRSGARRNVRVTAVTLPASALTPTVEPATPDKSHPALWVGRNGPRSHPGAVLRSGLGMQSDLSYARSRDAHRLFLGYRRLSLGLTAAWAASGTALWRPREAERQASSTHPPSSSATTRRIIVPLFGSPRC